MPQPPKLTVFLDHQGTLRALDESGILDRELILYRLLQEKGCRINFVTYGGRDDYQYASRMQGMGILCNWLGLPMNIYTRRLHQMHAPHLVRDHIVKSFDATGIVSALRASWAWKTPFVFRMGYSWSSVAQTMSPHNKQYLKRIDNLERQALLRAAHVIVATTDLAEKMVAMVPETAGRLTLIRHGIDTDLFRPMPREKLYDLVYVGRMHRVKNLRALLTAVERLGISIAMIGGGTVSPDGGSHINDEDKLLKDRFGDLDGRIHWLGRISNEELPSYINRAKVFVLCSFTEGNARSLIEAMACGMPVIGTGVSGIRTMLQHEVTGFLCGTDVDSLEKAIETVLAQPRLMELMGANARNVMLEEYGFEKSAECEYEILQQVASRNPVGSAMSRATDYVLRRIVS